MVNCFSKPDFNPASRPVYPTAMDQLAWMFHKHLKLTTPRIVTSFPPVTAPTVFLISVSGTSQTYRLPELVKILIQKVRDKAQHSLFLTSSQSMLVQLMEDQFVARLSTVHFCSGLLMFPAVVVSCFLQ